MLPSEPTRRKAEKLTGSTSAMGTPSSSSPTRPSSSQRARRSGFSVCSSCGKGDRGRSASCSSSTPRLSTPSTSIPASRRASSRTTAGSATSSTNTTARRVWLLRPSVCSAIFSRGVARCRRSRAVLARSVSTKLSRLPLSDFSSVGSPTVRQAPPRRSKLSAHFSPGKTRAQRPWVRSKLSASGSSRRATAGQLTAPKSSACRQASSPASPSIWSASGRSSVSAVSRLSTSPSSQHRNSSHCPTRSVRLSKSAQRRKMDFRLSGVTAPPYSGCRLGCAGTSAAAESKRESYILCSISKELTNM